jgi:hypothetical protein
MEYVCEDGTGLNVCIMECRRRGRRKEESIGVK